MNTVAHDSITAAQNTIDTFDSSNREVIASGFLPPPPPVPLEAFPQQVAALLGALIGGLGEGASSAMLELFFAGTR